jgi:hypothetical protein
MAGLLRCQNKILSLSYHGFSPLLSDFTRIDSIFYTKPGNIVQLINIQKELFIAPSSNPEQE